MTDEGGLEHRWTQEQWERMLEEERRSEEARPPTVGLGSRVEIELLDAAGVAESLAVVLVRDPEADLSRGYLGVGTPLARAVEGQEAGSTVPYSQGDIVAIRVLRVAVGELPATGVANERKAILQNAIDKSEMVDMLRLALTVDLKWGSYDPDGITPEEDPADQR